MTRRYVRMHTHSSALSGPDPAHHAALHRPGPVQWLLTWPPRGAPWTDTYLSCHRLAIYLLLLADLIIVLLVRYG